jgi:hypothetical protein
VPLTERKRTLVPLRRTTNVKISRAMTCGPSRVRWILTKFGWSSMSRQGSGGSASHSSRSILKTSGAEAAIGQSSS